MKKISKASIATDSYWSQIETPRFPSVDSARTFDVVVIGAGVTGITTAYLLKREGRRVALVERGRCGGQDTPCTTAHLTCVTDTPLSSLVRAFGEDHARATWDAGFAAIFEIDEIVRLHDIACDFKWVSGFLHAPVGDLDEADEAAEVASLLEEADQAVALGFDARYLEHVPFIDAPGIEIPGQARMHPLRYLRALLEEIDGDGSAVFEESAVSDVSSDPLTVVVNGEHLRTGDVIVATHNPIVGQAGWITSTLLQTKLALYTSYVLAERVPSGALPDDLFWDTADPYHYLRLEPADGQDVVIYGGEDHKTGQVADTVECFTRLESHLRSIVPNAKVTHRWSGQVIETIDGLPLIGEMAPHQYAATGFSGNGMTFGTVGAMMMRDAVTGRANPWRELFDIGRTKLAGAWDYLKENKDYPYYLVRDRFAGAEGRSTRDIPRQSGKVIEFDGRKTAVYRAADGRVTKRSATCMHMGCVVKWNVAERTWDCPCHGSRFDPTGHVLSGPAESDLARFQPKH